MSVSKVRPPAASAIDAPPAGVGEDLFRQQARVGQEWIHADDGSELDVLNPSTGMRIGVVPNLGPDETRRAIALGVEAQRQWAALTVQQRGAILHRWSALMLARREELARLMTFEEGKPLDEARGEIDYAAGFLSWFAEEAKRQNGEIIPTHLPGKRLFSLRAPIGVVAAITPWNFPSAMITRKAGAALAAGCAMVVRPASESPYSALALAVLAEEAGVPPGVFSIVTGDPQPITEAMMRATEIRHLSFTGSTEVGRLLLGQAAHTVKKVALELGGHAPFIVFADADIEVAAQGAIAAKFQTSGEDCLAANRILVHRSIYEAFCRRFTELTLQLQVGDGFTPGVAIGPLIDARAVAKCRDQVRDAVTRGARLLGGGSGHAAGANFFEPTVLADVTPAMRIFSEETFGPVAALIPFDEDQEAVAIANDSEFGLAAYCYGTDLKRLWRSAIRLEYGMIGVNTAKMTGPPIPFGGIKQSGLGREGARQGLDEYTEIRYLCIDGLDAP